MKHLTKDEQATVFRAAADTWQTIGSDAMAAVAEMGEPFRIEDAIEFVVDAGRMLQYGKLSEELYEKLLKPGYPKVVAFMKKNRGSWY